MLIRRGSRGFTLIELLVVLAIMAILSTIGFVSVNYAINKGKSEEYNAKCRDAIENVNRKLDLVNENITTVGGVTYTGTAEQIIEGMLAEKLPNLSYNIDIVYSNAAPTVSAVARDTIVVYIPACNQAVTIYTSFTCKGAWFIKKGGTTASYTFDNVTVTGASGAASVTA